MNKVYILYLFKPAKCMSFIGFCLNVLISSRSSPSPSAPKPSSERIRKMQFLKYLSLSIIFALCLKCSYASTTSRGKKICKLYGSRPFPSTERYPTHVSPIPYLIAYHSSIIMPQGTICASFSRLH